MTKRNMTPAILIAVVVSVLLAGLVAARPDTYTNSNIDQNSNGSNTSGRASSTSGSQNTNASMGPRVLGTTQYVQNLSQPIWMRTNAWNGVGRIAGSRAGS